MALTGTKDCRQQTQLLVYDRANYFAFENPMYRPGSVRSSIKKLLFGLARVRIKFMARSFPCPRHNGYCLSAHFSTLHKKI